MSLLSERIPFVVVITSCNVKWHHLTCHSRSIFFLSSSSLYFWKKPRNRGNINKIKPECLWNVQINNFLFLLMKKTGKKLSTLFLASTDSSTSCHCLPVTPCTTMYRYRWLVIFCALVCLGSERICKENLRGAVRVVCLKFMKRTLRTCNHLECYHLASELSAIEQDKARSFGICQWICFQNTKISFTNSTNWVKASINPVQHM